MLLLVTAATALRAPMRARAPPTRLHFLSPEMSGAIAKLTDGANYEKIVQETMVRENCDYEEAVARYNQFLFDPDGREGGVRSTLPRRASRHESLPRRASRQPFHHVTLPRRASRRPLPRVTLPRRASRRPPASMTR